ncbi:MAG: ATP-binding cassette domain-containing protein [Anaerolineae bacterium]|nr:ATP-binding cassette domain-containing protein [Anaerolineae bacterium]
MLIQVEDLTHVYAPGTPFERVALRQVNLQIGAGERVGILGPTGSGKSTLAQHLAGLLKPTAGRVLLDGVPVHSAPRDHRLQVGIAFQYPEDQIFEQTVFREVAFGPRNLGLDEAEVTARVHWALEMAGLNPETMSQRMPFTLSGGEMRRVALAGILALRPRVLILDEPTAGQDPQSRRGLLARILAWQQETGLTLIIISHTLEELVLSPSTDPSLRSGLRLRTGPAEGLGQVVERLVMLKEGQVVADGPTQRILSDEALLNTIGLDVPEPIRLLRALRQKGKKVRTDLVSTAEAAAEIAHVWGLPHAQRGWAILPFAGEERGGA